MSDYKKTNSLIDRLINIPEEQRAKGILPFHLLAIITISIFVAESILMYIFTFLPALSMRDYIFIDSFLLIGLISPTLYCFIFRPLVIHISERKRVEEELERSRLKLIEESKAREAARNRHLEEIQQERDALFKSEEQTRLIVETALDAVVSIDTDGLITGWNNQAEIIFGWSRSEAVGQPLSATIVPLQYREMHKCGLTHFQEKSEGHIFNQRIELSALHSDGHEFPVEISISHPVKLGQTFAFTAFVRDITERKQAEEELKMAKEIAEDKNKKLLIANTMSNELAIQAQKANVAKSEFLANISHEIRTPMNGIIGMTELLSDTKLTSEQNEYLDLVKESAKSLLMVINDILDFSKIEMGKLEIKPIKFNLRDCLGQTIETIGLQARQKELDLIWHVSPDVPDTLIGDPGRLRQIIVNLLGNAVKFSKEGKVVIRVEKKSQTQDYTTLHFAVIDKGIGIPADKLDLIFEAFSQSDGSSTRRYGGTGLGLAIVSRLVRLMDGQIFVESEEGMGSKFHFTIRLKLQKDVKGKLVPIRLKELQNLTALVVDKNAMSGFTIKEILAKCHMNSTIVDNEQAALSTLKQAYNTGNIFTIVILLIPEIDGFTLAGKIKKDSRFTGVRLVIISSIGKRGEGARCKELNIDGYLTKPIIQSELLDTIVTVLGNPLCKGQPPLVTRHLLRENRQNLHILLAEDNVVNRKQATCILEKRGHTVVSVDNGKKVLAALGKESFDLILMDMQMPEMDGLRATKAIREKEKNTKNHIPIIAMTASDLKTNIDNYLTMGIDGYVSKPIKVDELLEIIEKPLTNFAEDSITATLLTDTPSHRRKMAGVRRQ